MSTNLYTKSVSEISATISSINDLAVLADNLGALKLLIEELEAKETLFADLLKAKLGDGERAIGDTFTALKSVPKPSARLDAKKLEEDLGKETLAPYYKPVKNSPRLTVDRTKLWDTAA